MGPHSQYHHVLRDNIKRHDQRLAHDRSAPTSEQCFRCWSSAVIRANVSYSFVRVNVTGTGEDLHGGYPESAIQTAHSFLAVDLRASVNHSAVNIVLELHLQLRLYHSQWEQGATHAKRGQHREGKKLRLVHHIPFDGAEVRRIHRDPLLRRRRLCLLIYLSLFLSHFRGCLTKLQRALSGSLSSAAIFGGTLNPRRSATLNGTHAFSLDILPGLSLTRHYLRNWEYINWHNRYLIMDIGTLGTLGYQMVTQKPSELHNLEFHVARAFFPKRLIAR